MKLNKQTVIQIEWIELGFEPSNSDENGWVDFDFLPENFDLSLCECKNNGKNVMARPKSLKGIENNNGWISILSESDLPIEDCDCHIEFEDGVVSIDRYFVFGKNFTSNHWKHIVAYRLIEKPNKRIY